MSAVGTRLWFLFEARPPGFKGESIKTVVGIVTRGRAELAEKAVASALMQQPPPDLVWVIEDGLVGKPFEWKKGGPVRITRWPEPRGFMAGRHLMMMEAPADIFVSLDDDAWFLKPDTTGKAVQVFRENPDVAAVGFEILSPDRPQPSGRNATDEAVMFIGCGHALRLRAVREAGGYEWMPGFYGGEERDLSLRLLDRGWRIVKLEGAEVWHEKTPNQRDLAKQRRAGVLNDLSLIWRRCPGAPMWFYLGGNIIHQILFSLQQPQERLWPSLRGILDFLFFLPRQAALRKPVSLRTWQAQRKRSAKPTKNS